MYNDLQFNETIYFAQNIKCPETTVSQMTTSKLIVTSLKGYTKTNNDALNRNRNF